jgi:hypothetical protein
MRDGGGGAWLHGYPMLSRSASARCVWRERQRGGHVGSAGLRRRAAVAAMAGQSARLRQHRIAAARTSGRADMHALSFFAPCRLADRDRTEFGSERGRVCASRFATATT